MDNPIRVKICGLKEHRHIEAAVSAGAGYLGFNFFEKSPRYVTVDQANQLVEQVPAGVARVALTVDANDVELDRIVHGAGFDMLQLHGQESPDRVAEIQRRYGLPVMKVLGVASQQDLEPLTEYGRVADQIMVDAKPPKGAVLPGGNGLVFDWQLITGQRWPVPWMLAGGLNDQNVAQAIQLTGARQVDVSSGVETGPGQKSSALIRKFIKVALAG